MREEMARIAGRYYVDPARGVEEELRFGNQVYASRADGVLGAFLIVNLDHHQAVLAGRVHRFTYLGLGCASGAPMSPVFRRAKSDLQERLSAGQVGVLHLTTRTPYAIRGVEKAFGSHVFPAALPGEEEEPCAIARYLKASVHRHAPRAPNESPFVLRELKQGRFREEEVARIRAFEGASAIARFGIECAGADEIIAFHRFDA
jgi:hypothetical protein